MALINWLNPASNPFDTASAWSTGTVPGAGDDATIGITGNYGVSVTDPFSVKSLSITDTGATLYNTTAVAEQIAGNLINAGAMELDDNSGNQGGSTLTAGGKLQNSGGLAIGPNNNSITANSTVKAASLSNSGTIDLYGSFPGSYQATLNITGAAGFGAAGLLTGQVSLIGDTLIEFGSGQITKIAAGATLDLTGQARVADASGTTTNSALAGFANNAGLFQIGDGDTVATTGAFTNSGTRQCR